MATILKNSSKSFKKSILLSGANRTSERSSYLFSLHVRYFFYVIKFVRCLECKAFLLQLKTSFKKYTRRILIHEHYLGRPFSSLIFGFGTDYFFKQILNRSLHCVLPRLELLHILVCYRPQSSKLSFMRRNQVLTQIVFFCDFLHFQL